MRFVIISKVNTEKNRKKDISVKMLEKLVKASGDDCVAGYVRYRRIRECKGYDKARKRAARHFSKVIAGRPMENNCYAAVVRFRLIVFLIPIVMLVIALLLFMRRQSDVKAIEVETTSAGVVHPDETIAPVDMESRYAGLYINVPGFSDMVWNEQSHVIPVYNPENNECIMTYTIKASGENVATSRSLAPGESEMLDFRDRLESGVYDVEIIAAACSLEEDTQFNSVYQKVKLTVY